ncbi:hypothetical protein [Ideonella sp.]|uniref:hypothetical protein n=1 Tax=Ideonella sp. TaxID=1929293 RepID=UPI0037C13FFA
MSPCQGRPLERLGPLQCTGPADEVQRVLQSLATALGPLTTGLSSALAVVHALHLGPDDAELILTVPPHCAGARLSDAAFHALRFTLPDRDIYIRHPVPQSE